MRSLVTGILLYLLGVGSAALASTLKEYMSKQMFPALRRRIYAVYARLGGHESLIKRYKRLQLDNNEVKLMRVGYKDVQIDISKQYIKLRLTHGFIPPSQRDSQTKQQPTFSPQELLQKQRGFGLRLIILGHPGFGKTTLLKHLMLTYSQEQPILTLGFLPILLFLRRLRDGKGRDLLQFMLDSLAASLPAQLVVSKLERGECLILLDGLDELVGDDQRRIVDDIRELSSRYSKNTFIVTSRIDGYARDAESSFKEAEIAPLDPLADEAKSFVSGVLDARDLQERFLEILRADTHLRRLAESPLLLGLILFIYKENERQFPRKRTAIYTTFTRGMLRYRDEERLIYAYRNKFDSDYKDLFLRKVAHGFFVSGASEFTRSQLLGKISGLSHELHIDEQEGAQFLDEIVKYNGLLQNTHGEHFSFAHPTFQEYYVAKEIKETSTVREEAYRRIADPAWTEVILFLSGLLDLQVSEKLIEFIIEDRLNYVFAGRCLAHARASIPSLSSRIVPRLLRDQSREAKQALVEIGDAFVAESLLAMLDDSSPVLDDRSFAADCLRELDTKVIAECVMRRVEELRAKHCIRDAYKTVQRFSGFAEKELHTERSRLQEELAVWRKTVKKQAVARVWEGDFSGAEAALRLFESTEELPDDLSRFLRVLPELELRWKEWWWAIESDVDDEGKANKRIRDAWHLLDPALRATPLPRDSVLELAGRFCEKKIHQQMSPVPRQRWVRRQRLIQEVSSANRLWPQTGT